MSNARTTKISILRSDDQTIIRIFQKAKEEAEKILTEEKEYLFGENYDIQTTYASNLPWRVDIEEISSSTQRTFTITQAKLQFSGHAKKPEKMAPHLNTPIQTVSFTITRGSDKPHSDDFTITGPDTTNGHPVMDQEIESKIIRVIHQTISKLVYDFQPSTNGLEATLTNITQAFQTSYQQILSETQINLNKIHEEGSSQRENITQYKMELETKYKEKEAELDKLYKNKEHALEEEINKQREELQKEKESLEISSHKDARRKQFIALQEELQKNIMKPTASKNMIIMRWLVFLSLIGGASLSGTFVYSLMNNPQAQQTGSEIFQIAKMSILTLVSLGFVTAAATWLRYFYNKDQLLLENQTQFKHDMARSSWVMDAMLEIKKEHNEEIPDGWLEGLTKGLFEYKNHIGKLDDTPKDVSTLLATLNGLITSMQKSLKKSDD